MLNTAVIVIGGDPIPEMAMEELPDRRWVIAADSGLDHASAIGLRVDFIVGDMDSVSDTELREHTGPVDRHPINKDATDFEIALDHALATPNITRIIVLGGVGGRIDHFLANAAVIASPRFASLDVEWCAGDARVSVVRDHAALHGTAGQTVSLIPVGGGAHGVKTTGLAWNLDHEPLEFGSTRGVSNTFVSPVAIVTVESGALFAVMPEALRSQ